MSEKKTEAVEVLAPEKKETQKCTSGALLQSVAIQLHDEFEAFGKLENEASFRALRIGILLLKAKENLKHGEFEPWLEKNVTEVRRRQAFNFMRLAKIFIENKHIEQHKAYLLCEAKSEPAIKASPAEQKLVQAVFDFIQDKSLNDLFKEHGIKDAPKPKGGANQLHAFLKEHYPDHPEYIKMSLRELPAEVKKEWEKHLRAGGIPTSEQFNKITYQAVWRMLVMRLRENGLEKKTYSYLTHQELEEVHGTLIDVKKEIMEALKK